MRTAIMCGALVALTSAFMAVLAGCAHAAGPTPPAPEFVWSKPGASNDEFQRTKAACMLRMLEAENANPNGWSWAGILPLCMRAAGWVRVRRP